MWKSEKCVKLLISNCTSHKYRAASMPSKMFIGDYTTLYFTKSEASEDSNIIDIRNDISNDIIDRDENKSEFIVRDYGKVNLFLRTIADQPWTRNTRFRCSYPMNEITYFSPTYSIILCQECCTILYTYDTYIRYSFIHNIIAIFNVLRQTIDRDNTVAIDYTDPLDDNYIFYILPFKNIRSSAGLVKLFEPFLKRLSSLHTIETNQPPPTSAHSYLARYNHSGNNWTTFTIPPQSRHTTTVGYDSS